MTSRTRACSRCVLTSLPLQSFEASCVYAVADRTIQLLGYFGVSVCVCLLALCRFFAHRKGPITANDVDKEFW
jgi:hypothetical protein